MLQERTIVDVADNSGASKIMLFAVNGKNNRASAGIGEVVVGSVKKASVGSKIKKGSVVHVLIVRTRNKVQRRDGSSIKFSDNAVVVVNKNTKEPVATRVFGPVARELREMGHSKVISMAEEVL